MKTLKKWMNLSDTEAGLFVWSALLIFLIRCAGLLFNNFSETAFLKRFGVEFLPVIYIINPIITLVVLARLSNLMDRVSGYRVLGWCLVFCGLSVSAFRALIPLETGVIYPVLFVMKVQFETILGILFWNLANDLFNLRQSKRLFPLITAGGVVGDISGSVFTPVLAQAVSIDNLVVVYGFISVSAALLVFRMRNAFPAVLVSGRKGKKKKKGESLLQQFAGMRRLMKSSALVTVLVLLTFFANVVLPVMNYQFNFAVDRYFATETQMLQFFGYFRAVMNAVSLGLLFYSGRFYGKFGLPLALMFHPANYVFVFLAFLFRFDVFSAMYARFSTNVFRTVFNKPVNNILIGIFPESYRSRVRPFLRGAVARTALMGGSLLILATDGFFHPKYLSIAVLPFVAGWILTALYLKRKYPVILSNLLSRDMIDLRSMEQDVLKKVFQNERVRQELLERFRNSEGRETVLYARILQFLSIEDLDDHLLYVIRRQGTDTAKELLPFLSEKAGDKAFDVLKEMIDVDDTELMISMIHAVKPLGTQSCGDFYQTLSARCSEKETDACRYPEVKAYSNACLFSRDPEKYEELIHLWLNSLDREDMRAGIIAIGEIGDKAYIPKLRKMLEENRDNYLSAALIEALGKLGADGINKEAESFLNHPVKETRAAGLHVFVIENDVHLRKVIDMLSETDESLRRLAAQKIRDSNHQNNRILFASLNKPCRRTRESLFRLIEEMEIKYVDLFYSFKSQLSICYVYQMISRRLRKIGTDPVTGLLADHLDQRTAGHIKTVLRVSSIKDETGQMRPIFRSFYSKDPRSRANAVEGIENIMAPALVRILLPLIDGSSDAKVMQTAKRHFELPEIGENLSAICSYLAGRRNRVTVMLALFCAVENRLGDMDAGILTRLAGSDNRAIQELAETLLNGRFDIQEEEMEQSLSLYEKIVHIQKVDIFTELNINELAAIAAITEEEVFPQGYTVFTEGEVSETMYIAVTGEVKVSRNNTEVGRFRPGESFGLSAFLVDDKRLVTCTAMEETHLLVIYKREFEEMLMEYPQISLQLAKKHAKMIQRVLNKIGGTDNTCEYALEDFFNRAEE